MAEPAATQQSETTPVDLTANEGLPVANVNYTQDYTAGQKDYDFTSRVFPSNLGNDYLGHWLVLNINVQDSSKMSTVTVKETPQTNFTTLNGEKSKTDAYRFGIDKNYLNSDRVAMNPPSTEFNLGDINVGNFPGITRQRNTTRIKESIAIYMPNSELTFSDAHDFDNISLTKFGAAIAGGMAKFVSTGIGSATLGVPAGVGLGQFVGDVGSGAGQFIGNAMQILGSPINPKVEVLFTNTFQREFVFDFLFSPSTEKESQDIENIIRTIRFHAAPETQPDLMNSFFWIPPSEFDITFYYKNESGEVQENTKIPRINTCVLKQIDVSYSPTGAYSTCSNGHPVQIRMQLRFIETEVVHKLRVMQGF